MELVTFISTSTLTYNLHTLILLFFFFVLHLRFHIHIPLISYHVRSLSLNVFSAVYIQTLIDTFIHTRACNKHSNTFIRTQQTFQHFHHRVVRDIVSGVSDIDEPKETIARRSTTISRRSTRQQK